MTADSSMRIQKILVVDDNSSNRQVAEAHLVAAGYSVALAESGEEGIEKFKEWAPDLVLLDILMPKVDGFEACRRLKATPGGKDVPVVFLTALSDLGSHQRAIESGADDFLTKPINRTELLIRVRSLLWVKRLREELTQGYDLIRSQRDALLQAQRQKEELSALVVHDLKSPLTAILFNVQYLVTEATLADEDRDALREVLSAADAMHRMVVNLLDISRSEDGTLVPKLVEVDLGALIEEVCAVATRRSGERKLKVTHEVSARTVRADTDLLRRLIENLVDNGIKYTEAGAIQVRAQLCGDGSVEIRVSDEGPGVPEEDRERIFEKYVQLDRDAGAHAARSSRGLGLTFCRLAAEAHGGRIWVEANHPQGCSFCVRMPAGSS